MAQNQVSETPAGNCFGMLKHNQTAYILSGSKDAIMDCFDPVLHTHAAPGSVAVIPFVGLRQAIVGGRACVYVQTPAFPYGETRGQIQ